MENNKNMIALYTKFVLLCVVPGSVASRFLVVFPPLEDYDSTLGSSLVDTLLGAGHEVTYVTVYPEKTPNPNLTYVDISSVLAEQDRLALSPLPLGPRTPWQSLQQGTRAAELVLRHEAVQQLMVDPALTFDAVIVYWFYSGLLSPLGELFNCPLIWYSAGDASWHSLQLMHEAPTPLYSLDPHFEMPGPPPLSVVDRMRQIWRQFYFDLLRSYQTDFIELPIYQSVFKRPLQARGRALAGYPRLARNGSLLLLGSLPPLAQPLALPLNVKHVGGYHMELPVKPLPKAYGEYFKNTHGLILVDLGPKIKSSDLPEHLSSRLLKMFSQLEQTVLWRLEGTLAHVPSNVYLLETVPHLSVLSHPKTMMYITDGNMAGLIEALYCGVPVVGAPLVGDQFLSAALVAARGFGVKVHFSHYLASDLQAAIGEILGNYKYRMNAMEASRILKNGHMPTRSELLHQIQQVIASGGAPHLRSPAFQISTIERYHLDILFLLAMIFWFLTKVVKVIKAHLKDYEHHDKKQR